jgi:alpha 1,2-mannosyltransferase
MNKPNAAIFILTQNTIDRKIYLKTCLYFLFRNFNKVYNYPIVILHEGDYDQESQKEIITSIRSNHRHLITFKEIDKQDFSIPSHIDQEVVNKIIAIKPVPYWRNVKYRMMCNFWLQHFQKYTKEYDYVMRLDDDSIIEEPIEKDLFHIMKEKDMVYMSNIVHLDCGICNYNMKEMFQSLFPNMTDKIETVFVSAKLSPNMKDIYDKMTQILKINGDYDQKNYEQDIEMNMPVMYYNNFFVTSTKFWERDDVKAIVEKINQNGGIFYYRYGDAPLQTLIVTLMEPTRIARTTFKYSKRLQREAFCDGTEFHSYMPKSYDDSSCIIKK